MITPKGIFFVCATCLFSKLRQDFSKIPKPKFRIFYKAEVCMVEFATMDCLTMLQWVIRGQANRHRPGLGRPDPGHSGAPKSPPRLPTPQQRLRGCSGISMSPPPPAIPPYLRLPPPSWPYHARALPLTLTAISLSQTLPTAPCFKARKCANRSCVAIRATNNSRALNSFRVPSESASLSSAS